MANVTKILIAIVIAFCCYWHFSKNAVKEVEVKDFKECRDLYQLWKKLCFQVYLKGSPSEYNMFQEWCQTLFNSNIRQKRDATESLPEIEALNLINNKTLSIESVTQQGNNSSVEECDNSSRSTGGCKSSDEKESSNEKLGDADDKKPGNKDRKNSNDIIDHYESPKPGNERLINGIKVAVAIVLLVALVGVGYYASKKYRARQMGGGEIAGVRGAVDRAQIPAARFRDLLRNEGDVAQGGQIQRPIQRENTDSGTTSGEDEIHVLPAQPTELTTSADASTSESITSSL